MPKVILISGGSDGLGKAIAKKLVSGNQVVILAHNKAKLESVAKELGCDFVEAEMTDYNSLKSAIDQVISKYQKIDVLVNNAGVWMEGQLDDSDPEKIKELIEINTTGTILLTKAVLPGMRSQKSGQIINIISQDGLCAKKDRSIYHASKWAITGFTKCLQEDMEGENIKVTAVNPGLMKTSLFEKNNVDRDLTDALEPSEVADVVEYVINLSSSTYIPEVSIKNKQNNSSNMDNTNAPTIDLNIDPNMIAAQDDTPQVSAPTPVAPSPLTPPMPKPGVIDITPGSTDVFPPIAPISNHIDVAPLAEPKTLDITPSAPDPAVDEPLSHLSDINSPEPIAITAPEEVASPVPVVTAPVAEPVAESASEPTVEPITTPVSEPSAIPQIPVFDQPTAVTAAPTQAPLSVDSTPAQPVTPANPSHLAEDPDLVKLIK